jgi:hypothetical protein
MVEAPDTRLWHPRVRKLFEYWRSLHRASGRLPGRAAFDPLAIPALLPYLTLIDVVGRPPRFRYRLIGTRMVDALNGDFTGQWLDEVHARPDGSKPVFPSYTAVAMEGRPDWRRGPPHFAGFIDRCTELERVFLPLASDGETVDIIITINVFFDAVGTEI